MKIVSVETLQLKEHPRFIWTVIRTDTGLVGVGESTDKTELTKSAIHNMCADVLLGKDPTRIEHCWNEIYSTANYHGYCGAEMRALSAVDIALWDILGKIAGMPVYQLLGGNVQESVKIYNTCISYGDIRDRERSLEDAGALAKELLREGIHSMKICPFDSFSEQYNGQYISYADIARGLEPIRQIREAVGNDMEISLEAHGRWNMPMSIRIAKELEKYNVTWLEDPLPVDDVGNYAKLRAKIDLPILASERLFTRFQYKPLLEQGATDLLMMDVGWTGGLTECKKIASMADSYRIPITTHNCGGPVLTLASAHLCISCPNSYGTESVRAFYKTFYSELCEQKLDIRDGHLYLPNTPGIGITLKEELFSRADVIHEVTTEPKNLIFAAAGDPWASSPGDEKAGKCVPSKAEQTKETH